MRARRLGVSAVCLALAMSLSGCGVPDRVVGVRPVPSETISGAPLDTSTAAAIASRVLVDAATARALDNQRHESAHY